MDVFDIMNNYAYEAVRLLTERKMKITTAESCTGGMIAQMITDISGASSVFDCGIVSYSNEIKHSLLGVSEETLKTYGAVSEETVREMVSGALKISGADIAVAVSGIAGPLSDNTQKPVGLIYIAVATDNNVHIKKLNNSFNVNIRENNRNSAANEALKLVCEILENKAV
ncbi:MAG: CinA family protein [Clostridia bacterium]|nr:CinA family protein [Clostridia bacterium]